MYTHGRRRKVCARNGSIARDRRRHRSGVRRRRRPGGGQLRVVAVVGRGGPPLAGRRGSRPGRSRRQRPGGRTRDGRPRRRGHGRHRRPREQRRHLHPARDPRGLLRAVAASLVPDTRRQPRRRRQRDLVCGAAHGQRGQDRQRRVPGRLSRRAASPGLRGEQGGAGGVRTVARSGARTETHHGDHRGPGMGRDRHVLRCAGGPRR